MERSCIYHAGCPDGFGAAWAVWRAWGDDARYIARGHEDRLNGRNFEDATVVFVDIAPSNEELVDLSAHASQIVVLDHHVSAQSRIENDPSTVNHLVADGHIIHFDMSCSGAVLAWQYFHPNEPTPDLLRYVQDQDLWTWALPDSREVNAAIASYERSFDAWSQLAARGARDLAREGEPIVRSNRVEVERILRTAAPLALGTRRVESVNASANRSSIGHELAQRKAYGEPWGCVYRVEGDRVYATLYSIGDFDVSAIAVDHGGGGHKNAAGFSCSLSDWIENFVC